MDRVGCVQERVREGLDVFCSGVVEGNAEEFDDGAGVPGVVYYVECRCCGVVVKTERMEVCGFRPVCDGEGFESF